MTTHVALLRAINLGSHNKVAMADLKDLCEKLELRNARSLLQSGNLVFDAGPRTTDQIEKLLQQAAKKRFGLETDFFARTAKEWKTVVDDNPFPKEAKADPGHLVVVFLKDEPSKDAVAALEKAIVGREVVRAKGRHAYIVYPDGIGRSKLTAVLIEKKLGTRGTGRNWNTVLKVAALVS